MSNYFSNHRLAQEPSLVGLLLGLAIQDGAIRSVDDLAAQYLPELQAPWLRSSEGA
jgi:hypothetical protein